MTKNSTKNIDQEIDEVLRGAEKKDDNQAAGSEKASSPMAQLLRDNPIKVPKEGDKIEGEVVQIDNSAVYVDLGKLGTGVVYGKEIKDGFGKRDKLKIGDKIVAAITDLENEDGYVELSIREAVRDEAWNDLLEKKDKKEVVNTKVLDANKGGLMVEVNGIVGFMPVSQLTAEHYPRVEDGDKNKILEILKSFVGKEVSVCVLDAVKDEEKLIVSEKEAYRDREKAAISELRVGDVVEGEISGVVDFGAFLKFLPPSREESVREEDKLEGLVHISQLDWQLIEDPRDIIKVGDRVKAKIIAVDDTKISLSIRGLKVDPWSEVAKRYAVGDVVEGRVHKINHFGAFVYLDKDIHGLAHISGFLAENPRKNIDEVIKVGEAYNWEIMSLDPREHRMGLKLSTKKIGKKDEPEEKPEAKEEAKAEEKMEEKPKKEKKKAKEETPEEGKPKKEKTAKKKAVRKTKKEEE